MRLDTHRVEGDATGTTEKSTPEDRRLSPEGMHTLTMSNSQLREGRLGFLGWVALVAGLRYYPMAMAVSLVTLNVIRRRISPYMLVWLSLVALTYYPLPWGFSPVSHEIAPWIWQILILSAASYWPPARSLRPLLLAADTSGLRSG
jgi:hypothetical protein